MQSTTSFRPGDLLLLDFPFTGGVQAKVRPGLVLLDNGDADVLVARITTRVPMTPFEVQLTDWQQAGLLRPSTVRLHKLIAAEKTTVIRRIGQLTLGDHQRVAAVLNQMFANW
jgi:mRNA interferase MazF